MKSKQIVSRVKLWLLIMLGQLTHLSLCDHTLNSENNPPPPSIIFDATLTKQPSIKQAYDKTEIYNSLRMFAEVISLMEQKGFRHVNFKHFIEEALKNAMSYCDPHSSFFDSKSFLETKQTTSGKFPGIGVSCISKLPTDDEMVITDVIEGGPSFKAGIKAGDKIVEVEGEKIRGLSSDEVIAKLKGREKSKVTIKIIRKKELLEFSIMREIIKNEVATAYYIKDKGIYYISLRLFTENVGRLVSDIIKRAHQKTCRGLILDLRRNPGGVLQSAVELSSLFIPKGSLVVSAKDRNHKTVSEYKTMNEPILDSSIPIFLLIDNFSASASEILAGCLRHYSDIQGREVGAAKPLRVFLLGVETWGKGSVQEIIPLSNNCALKLTSMLYYLPNNVSIQALGVKPDFMVHARPCVEEERKTINDFVGRESKLAHYITREEVDNPKKEQPTEEEERKAQRSEEEEKELSWEEKRLKSLTNDNQIQAAINMISLLSLAQTFSPTLVSTRQKALDFLKKHYALEEASQFEKVK